MMKLLVSHKRFIEYKCQNLTYAKRLQQIYTKFKIIQQPMYCEQIVFCLAAQKRRGEGRRGVWILDYQLEENVFKKKKKN